MTDSFARTGTIVWVFICLLTALSTYLGEHKAPLSFLGAGMLPVLVLAIAMVKIRLIIMHFMEIAHSPLALRLIFELWIIVVFVLLLVMFLEGSGSVNWLPR